jgi:hypothetical protein
MAQRVSQGLLLAAALVALAAAPAARAQYRSPSQPPDNGSYVPQPHPSEDQVAVFFLVGRYVAPVTCKKTDGTALELPLSIVFKDAPEAGGNAIKATFFGIDVADVAYCYSLIERRIVDRRGTVLLRYVSYNRQDLGMSDFRRALNAGPITYTVFDGEISERGIGTDPGDAPPRTLSFQGGDSKLVIEQVVRGSDGAKLLEQFRPTDPEAKDPPRRFAFRFVAKDGSDFSVFAVEEAPRKRR